MDDVLLRSLLLTFGIDSLLTCDVHLHPSLSNVNFNSISTPNQQSSLLRSRDSDSICISAICTLQIALLLLLLLPLDETVAYRAVFVIVSGPDEWMGGRKRFGGQLNNSKTVCVSMSICANWELIGTHGRAIECAHLRPHVRPNPQTRGSKSLFQISANRLQVDENVNRAHFGIH